MTKNFKNVGGRPSLGFKKIHKTSKDATDLFIFHFQTGMSQQILFQFRKEYESNAQRTQSSFEGQCEEPKPEQECIQVSRTWAQRWKQSKTHIWHFLCSSLRSHRRIRLELHKSHRKWGKLNKQYPKIRFESQSAGQLSSYLNSSGRQTLKRSINSKFKVQLKSNKFWERGTVSIWDKL